MPKKLRDEIEHAPVHFEDGLLIFGEQRIVGASGDLTGLECTLNKWHVEDYTNGGVSTYKLVAAGVAFAKVLHLKAAAIRIGKPVRAIVSSVVDKALGQEPNCVVRMHVLREGSHWLSGSLETYEHESIIAIDSV